jgi:hypothetical protein
MDTNAECGPLGRYNVLQQILKYQGQRSAAEAEAGRAAHQCCEPPAPLVYWLLKRLPVEAPPVTLPCASVTIETQKLGLFSRDVAGMVIAAALQAVHMRHWAPPSKVCARAWCCLRASLKMHEQRC